MTELKEGFPDLLSEFAEVAIFKDIFPPLPSTLNHWGSVLLLLLNLAACAVKEPFGHQSNPFSMAPSASWALINHRIKYSVFMMAPKTLPGLAHACVWLHLPFLVPPPSLSRYPNFSVPLMSLAGLLLPQGLCTCCFSSLESISSRIFLAISCLYFGLCLNVPYPGRLLSGLRG